MGIFGYVMLAAFILFWVVLLVKFIRMTRSDRQDDNGENDS